MWVSTVLNCQENCVGLELKLGRFRGSEVRSRIGYGPDNSLGPKNSCQAIVIEIYENGFLWRAVDQEWRRIGHLDPKQ